MTIAADDPSIPFSRVSTFVRQVTHDVRNGLNALDLEAAFIAELVTDPEAAAEVKKLRSIVTNVAKTLQELSAHFGEPRLNRVELRARDFAEAFRERAAEKLGAATAHVEWSAHLDGELVDLDFELMTAALLEVLRNAFQFRDGDGLVRLNAALDSGEVLFEIRETKSNVPSDPATWGLQPLVSTRRGGYGLGLFRVHRIVRAHGGKILARFENGELVTRIALPAVTGQNQP